MEAMTKPQELTIERAAESDYDWCARLMAGSDQHVVRRVQRGHDSVGPVQFQIELLERIGPVSQAKCDGGESTAGGGVVAFRGGNHVLVLVSPFLCDVIDIKHVVPAVTVEEDSLIVESGPEIEANVIDLGQGQQVDRLPQSLPAGDVKAKGVDPGEDLHYRGGVEPARKRHAEQPSMPRQRQGPSPKRPRPGSAVTR